MLAAQPSPQHSFSTGLGGEGAIESTKNLCIASPLLPSKYIKLYFEKGKIGYDTSYVHFVSVPLKMGSDIYEKEKHIESAFAFRSPNQMQR